MSSENKVQLLFQKMTNAFPVWILGGSLIAFFRPELFTWFNGPLITAGLGMIMLGMGLTLEWQDFAAVVRFPKWAMLGVLLQYTVMPFLGWALGYVFGLPAPLAVGLVLVACCPGGTASNVVTYLARANLPLSVAMTAVSTFLAVIMTPILTAWLAGSRVEVNAAGLLINTFQVVILPVTAGILLNRFLPRVTAKITPYSPMAAVFFIMMIVASIVGAGREAILDAGFRLLGAVFSLHLFGFLGGYLLSRILLRDENAARTVSIEVGMQNSGLGAVLARLNFAHPLVAIPSALSSLSHCLIGSLFAAYWRRRPV